MPFFDPNEQQRLMAQMFGGSQGMAPFQAPQGQGGVGQNDPQIGPSFIAPGDAATGASMPGNLGVEAPDQFNRPVPNIGDGAMVRQPPNFSDNMPTDLPPGYAGDYGANQLRAGAESFAGGLNIGEDQKRRLIDAIIARGVI